MPFFHLGPTGDAFAGVFGGTAAVLLVGGPMLLRWQRNRQQFLLTQSALAQGVTRFPKGPPFWLLSLRQGIVTLTLGIGLFVVGGAASWPTWTIEPPSFATTQPTAMTLPNQATMPSGVMPAPALEPVPAGPGRLGPPLPNPALEEWHRMKSINSLGLMSLATGFVLTLLGIARIGFARTERRHEPDDESL